MAQLLALVLYQACASPFVCTDGTNLINGQTVFYDLAQAYGAYPSGDEYVSLIVINGLHVGGTVSPALDGTSIVIRGTRHGGDPAADVVFYSEHHRDGGGALSINAGDDTHAQILAVDWMGNLIIRPAPNDDGSQATDALHRGMLVDGFSGSGHVLLQSYPGNYMTLESRLAEQCAVLADGGQPAADGGTEVSCYADGGCCLNYAGKHGGLTFKTSVAQLQGWLGEFSNPGAYGGNDAFVIHATGAFGQANGLTRDQFATCPTPLVGTSLGQFYPGVGPGVFSYAADEDKMYICKLTGWSAL